MDLEKGGARSKVIRGAHVILTQYALMLWIFLAQNPFPGMLFKKKAD